MTHRSCVCHAIEYIYIYAMMKITSVFFLLLFVVQDENEAIERTHHCVPCVSFFDDSTKNN